MRMGLLRSRARSMSSEASRFRFVTGSTSLIASIAPNLAPNSVHCMLQERLRTMAEWFRARPRVPVDGMLRPDGLEPRRFAIEGVDCVLFEFPLPGIDLPS